MLRVLRGVEERRVQGEPLEYPCPDQLLSRALGAKSLQEDAAAMVPKRT